MSDPLIEKRRAIEALRAGVPNRDVVRQLPPIQSDLRESFDQLLSVLGSVWETGSLPQGLLLEGDFGTGKSHWLEYFRHAALERKFVVSSIVLNKETPLNDLKKVYRTCVESAIVSGKVGPALTEIAHTYHSDRAPYFDELQEWVNITKGIDPRYAQTLQIFVNTTDEEVRQQIVNEWTGYPMKVAEIRNALRDMGHPGIRVRAQMKAQELQQFEFLSRFFRSAGYSGWLILLDEGEIISRYSLKQRAKAYAHLAHLLGYGSQIFGLGSVLTITTDYAGQILVKRNDLEKIPAKLAGSREAAVVPLAQKGMELIMRMGNPIRAYTGEQVDDIYRSVRALYSEAYSWEAPELSQRPEVLPSVGMRRYIRSWINAWDFRRLYDAEVNLIAEDVVQNYEEDVDLQASDDEPAAPETNW